MALLKKTKQVNTRFTEEEYALLLLKARTERITVSDFIRQAAIGKKVSLSTFSSSLQQMVRSDSSTTHSGNISLALRLLIFKFFMVLRFINYD